jgi:hypothetical protein
MFVDFFNEEQRKRDIEGSIYITEKERESGERESGRGYSSTWALFGSIWVVYVFHSAPDGPNVSRACDKSQNPPSPLPVRSARFLAAAASSIHAAALLSSPVLFYSLHSSPRRAEQIALFCGERTLKP